MKSYITFLLVAFALMGLVLPMVLRGPDGQRILQPEELLPIKEAKQATDRVTEWLYDAGDMTESGTGVRIGLERPSFYRWQDERGKWHFSDQPPEDRLIHPEALRDAENVLEFPDTPSLDGDALPPSIVNMAEQYTAPYNSIERE